MRILTQSLDSLHKQVSLNDWRLQTWTRSQVRSYAHKWVQSGWLIFMYVVTRCSTHTSRARSDIGASSAPGRMTHECCHANASMGCCCICIFRPPQLVRGGVDVFC